MSTLFIESHSKHINHPESSMETAGDRQLDMILLHIFNDSPSDN